MFRLLVTAIIIIFFFCPTFADDFEVVRLSERIIVIRCGPPPATLQMTVIKSKVGLVVVDTFSSHLKAERALELMRKEFGTDKVAYVINSHHHFDHTFGNQVFSGAVIIGHQYCPVDMLADYSNMDLFFERLRDITPVFEKRLDEVGRESAEAEALNAWFLLNTEFADEVQEGFVLTPPDMTFSDRMMLDCGDLKVRLIYHGSGHSRSDILVYVPEEGIVADGDVFDSLDLPVIYTPDSNIPRWLEAWEEVLNDGKESLRVITGHHVILDRTTLLLFLDYVKDLWDEVFAARSEGLSLEQVKTQLKLKERFENLNHIHLLTGKDYHLTNIENIWLSQEKYH